MKSLATLSFVLWLPLAAPAQLATKPTTDVDSNKEHSWLLEDEKNTINNFNKSADSVIFVNTKTYARDFFSMDIREIPSGAGTGFIWDDQGHIVTNFHVVENQAKSQPVSITFKNGKTLNATIIGVEPHRDIAVLKLKNTKELPMGFAEKLADSSQIQVGQKTIAIGNPFELSHTLTTGVVSALGRSVPSPIPGISNRDMIQTDAAINPGNSGGPLMDSRGYLIGMNTAIYSQSGNSAGVGFAVPSNVIKRVVGQIIKHGKVIQPGLGIAMVPPEFAKRYLGVKTGVLIGTFMENQISAAERAGLKRSYSKRNGDVELGDVIIGLDGKKIEDLDDLYSALEDKAVGDKVKVDFLRKGKKQSLEVTLQEIKD